MTHVKNLHGTSDLRPTCDCDSWLEHWEVNKEYKASGYCKSCGDYVGHNELVGGHVIKVYSTDKNHYIVPICKRCNSISDNIFEVEEFYLVSANCNNCKNR